MLDLLPDAVVGARNLLGWELVHETAAGIISGRIVETEAYLPDDAASHSFNGQTARNSAMFGSAGLAYIYFTYGMHYCFNVVAGPKGSGQAVLIRALEPLQGIEAMRKNRKQDDLANLTNGPAKLAQALAITKDYYGADLSTGKLRLVQGLPSAQITATARVGINKNTDKPWRFYCRDSRFVSRP